MTDDSTMTLGDIAEILRPLREAGVALGAVTWVARTKVWDDEKDESLGTGETERLAAVALLEQHPVTTTTGLALRMIMSSLNAGGVDNLANSPDYVLTARMFDTYQGGMAVRLLAKALEEADE